MPSVSTVTRWLVPAACLACRAPVQHPASALCPECLRALPWLREGTCQRCGLPRHRPSGCPADDASFARAWAPLAYEGPARDLVRALKQRGSPVAGRLMGAQMAARLPLELRRGGHVVVAVPAHPLRGRHRGHNPAATLAAQLATRTGLSLHDCLRREDWSSRQAGSRVSTRREPGRIAVQLRATAPEVVILVDDVHTTGATLEACARALMAGGTRVVAAVAYARAL